MSGNRLNYKTQNLQISDNMQFVVSPIVVGCIFVRHQLKYSSNNDTFVFVIITCIN